MIIIAKIEIEYCVSIILTVLLSSINSMGEGGSYCLHANNYSTIFLGVFFGDPSQVKEVPR